MHFTDLPILEPGWELVGAHLQVMGAHPTRKGAERYARMKLEKQSKELKEKDVEKVWGEAVHSFSETAVKRMVIWIAEDGGEGLGRVEEMCGEGQPQPQPNQHQQQQVMGVSRFMVQGNDDGDSRLSTGGDNSNFLLRGPEFPGKRYGVSRLSSSAPSSSKRSSLSRPSYLQNVTWHHQDDIEWEAGEVWVTPDISGIFKGAWKDSLKSKKPLKSLTLLMEGASHSEGRAFLKGVNGSGSGDGAVSWKDWDRAVYGVHDEMGLCLAPTLVLKLRKV
jgi:hypothetical protein